MKTIKEKKKEFEEQFQLKANDGKYLNVWNEWHQTITPDDVWSWIESLLKEQREMIANIVADELRGTLTAKEMDIIDYKILNAPEPTGDKK